MGAQWEWGVVREGYGRKWGLSGHSQIRVGLGEW